jgi:hypothetical protein
MELLTSSRLKSFRACPRQHYLSYVQGYRPRVEASAMAFGTAVHEALAAWWSTGPAGAFELALQHLPVTLEPYARARAVAMLAGYQAFWESEGFEALAVEKEFKLPLLNPETNCASRTWQLAGKVDAIVRAPDGRCWVLEHKTTSEDASPGSAYRARLTLDGQVSQYVEGARALGYDVAGVIYDVLVKPALRPLGITKTRKVPESPEEYGARCAEAILAEPHRYLARAEVVRLEQDREDWQFDVWQLAEQMRASARTGRAPRNPDACFRYGQPCAFWPVCTREVSLEESHRYVRSGPNPELAQTAA